MAFPTSRQADSVEQIAGNIDGQVSAMVDRLQAWRPEVVAGTLSAQSTRLTYQTVTAARTYVQGKAATAGLADAYRRRFSALGAGFDPAVEWTAVNTAIVNWGTFIQTNWPRDANGRPTWEAYDATTGQLINYTVSLTGTPRTQLLALTDAILAAVQ